MAKGKYAAVVKGLPRFLATESSHQEKVDAAKKAIVEDPDYAPMRASRLAAEYAAARGEKDAAQEALSAVQVRLDAVEQLLIDHMEAEGLSSLKLDTGRSISTWAEPYPKVIDKEAFRRWCVDNGFERQLQLWPSTTSGIVKERLLGGEPAPPGIEVYARDVIRLGSER